MTTQTPLALAFPLRGSQLIEASAGTGKTFTISALYLRLVRGHGGEPCGFGRELLPPPTKSSANALARAWPKPRGFSARKRRPQTR